MLCFIIVILFDIINQRSRMMLMSKVLNIRSLQKVIRYSVSLQLTSWGCIFNGKKGKALHSLYILLQTLRCQDSIPEEDIKKTN